MIPEVNIISRKASVAIVNGAGGGGCGLGCLSPSAMEHKEHLNWIKKDLNGAEISKL